MARSVSGGAPPPSRALRVSSGNGIRPPLTAEPLHPLRSATKGQAGACPDRTQAIPCKVQQSSSEDRCRARCVPDRTVERGHSRSLTETRPHRLTCIDANQRPQTRSLQSWGSSSSLHDDLSRVLRVKAKPLRGRFASHDTAATAKRMAATRRTGKCRNQWAARRATRVRHRVSNNVRSARGSISTYESPVFCFSSTRGITRAVCRWYTSYRPRAPGCMIGARPMLWRLTRGHSRSRSSAEATEARAENFFRPIWIATAGWAWRFSSQDGG